MPETLEAPEVRSEVIANTDWVQRPEGKPLDKIQQPEPVREAKTEAIAQAEAPIVASAPEVPISKESDQFDPKAYLKSRFDVETEEQLEEKLELAKLLSDPFLSNFAKYTKQEGADPQFYLQVQSIDTAKFTDPKEPLVLKTMFEDKLTRREAELLITHNERYKLDEERYTDDEREVGAIDLKRDSNKAIQWLKEFQEQNKMTAPEKQRAATQQTFEQAEAARMNTWKSNIDTVLTEAIQPTLNLTLPTGNIEYKLDMTSALSDKAGIIKEAMLVLEDLGIDYNTKEGKAFAKEFTSNLIFNRNRDKFISQVITWREGQKEVEFAKRVHNPDYRITEADHSATSPLNTEWKERK